MKRILAGRSALPAAFAVLVLAAPVAAQDGNLAEIIIVEPRQGHGDQFEVGVRRHMEVLGDQGVDEAWFLWEIISGEDTGKFIVGTFGHTWVDFDEMPSDVAALERSFRVNIDPHVAGAQVGFWMYRPELSRVTTEEMTPTRFGQIYHFFPSFDGADDFEAVLGQIRSAADAQGWETDWGVYHLVNGGRIPHFVISIGWREDLSHVPEM